MRPINYKVIQLSNNKYVVMLKDRWWEGLEPKFNSWGKLTSYSTWIGSASVVARCQLTWPQAKKLVAFLELEREIYEGLQSE